jgi:hypothetical protein
MMASHPSAAAGRVSNRAATSSAASRNAASGDGPRGRAERDERRAHACEKLCELLVRRRAHTGLRAELLEPEGEGREWLEIAPRAPRR